MGGPGSGRSWGFSSEKCEDYRSIDLAWLRGEGVLERWGWSKITWSRGGQETASIQLSREANGIRLSYRSRAWGEDWQAIDELIPLVSTATNFGGRRLWFECLSCRRRCRILYGGRVYRCRTCHGLKYESQYEPPWVRAASRAGKIRERLGGSGSFDECFPSKPKGMHWRTYDQLQRKNDELNAEFVRHFMVWSDKLTPKH